MIGTLETARQRCQLMKGLRPHLGGLAPSESQVVHQEGGAAGARG